MEKKGWREELKILLEREEEEILLAERVAKPYSGKRREDIYNFVEKELDKAREEGRDSVLFPKFKREKNGTIKQDGWVNTFKFKDEKLNLYIWERVNMMSSNWHSEGGVVIVAKSLERAREIAKEHFNPEEEHSTLTDYDTTVFDTEPNRVFEVSSSEEYYCDFPDAGCC